MKRLLALVSLSFLLAALPSMGRSAEMLHFKGPVHDGGGARVTGPLQLTVRIYDAEAGGNLIAGPFGPFHVTPTGGHYSTGFGPVSMDRLEGGRRWLDLSTGARAFRRVELETVYYDSADRDGKLAGGRTLIPWFPESRAPSTSQRSTTPSTTILDNGPPSNRIDFVFVGDGYRDVELGLYATHVQGALTHLLSEEPYLSYRTFFNAHRIDVISNESGVDHETYGVTKDTALGMTFWCGGIERLLCVDVPEAYNYALLAPEVEQVIAVANSEKYGGAGYPLSDLATVAGGNSLAADLAVHETGHSLGNLADEYDYGDGSTYSGPEPVPPNVSVMTAEQMAAAGTKWASWLGHPGQWLGLRVGTYEGANYYQFGVYRPTEFSKMRTLGAPFNMPSIENLILEFYRTVRLLDAASPEGIDLTESSTAFVDPATPPGHPLAIQWYLDGNPIPGATDQTFEVASGGFEIGFYELSVTVTDATPFVRNETARAALMTETRAWPLLIGNRRPIVTAPATVTELENKLISFGVSADDPDGDPIQSLTAAGTAIDAGATFQEDGSHRSGLFEWTPTIAQGGEYRVTFTATSGITGRMTTVITVIDTDRAPEVTVPAAAGAFEGSPLTVAVLVTDPDDDPIHSLTAAGSAITAGAVFLVNPSQTSGTLHWTPDFSQAGSYAVTFTASNARSGSAATQISVADVDRAPEIIVQTPLSVSEGSELSFQVFADDADGDAIALFAATGSAIAAGATFTVDNANRSGEFRWTPGFTMAGEYDVTFAASNVLNASEVAEITVSNVDRPPLVTAPSAVNGAEGAEVVFDVSATDSDGDVTESPRAGELPTGAAFTVNPGTTAGKFFWVPDYDQAGTYSVVLSAESACRPVGVSGAMVCVKGTTTVSLTIANTDRAPAVEAPPLVISDEDEPIAFAVSAADPDGDPIASLQSTPLPFLASFVVGTGSTTGAFSWTPGFAEAGDFPITFTAMNALASSVTTTIRVRNVNRPPRADAGGPYAGVAGVPIDFHGSGSSDPDGDELAYTWDFGDGSFGSGAEPTHAYVAGGSYAVALAVSDPGTPPLAAAASTTATVTSSFESRVFQAEAFRAIRLGSGKPTWCCRVEPIDGNFRLEALVPASVELIAQGERISALPGKSTVVDDQDRNGIEEIEACFSKTDLRRLFTALPSGRNSVAYDIEGTLVDGAGIRGGAFVDVIGGSGALSVSLSPHPILRESTLTLSTSAVGRARVSLFDLQGRLVRILLDRQDLAPGYHDIRITPTGEGGRQLGSGVYFYRVEAAGTVETGRFVIAR